jgi:hypothetical protein
MTRAAAAVAAALCVVVAGCGSAPGDILGLGMSGGPLPEAYRMHVTVDGRGSCNRGPLRQLSDPLVLDARNLVRDAGPLSKQSASFGARKRGRRNFELRTPDGSVTWVEGAPGLPPVLSRAEELALQLQRALC